MVGTRRLAAIMAVDVANYARLMGEDEAGTARAVKEHRDAARPIVAGRGGRIVKTMGDGLLLEFPSVVDAVESAVEIQKLMVGRNAEAPHDKRIVYRIGVNLGDVLIEDEDILGDGVNIAARLERLCEPGEILISGAAYDQVRDKIEADFVDLGEKALKNISRPVRVFAIGPNARAAVAASPVQLASGAPRLSLVVLPFANIGGDVEQDYFVDGVTENLTTDLSRIRGAFVIGRNTAFTYKGAAVDLKQVGRELNVRYVLEGSVQRSGIRMRVNVQLIDAETGNHLWAERFDKPLADLFDMQDEIVARLANALNVQLATAEARRAEQVLNPDSLDLYFQGLAWVNRGLTTSNLTRAVAAFASALEIDPGNVDAMYGVAGANLALGALFPADRSVRLAAAESGYARVLSLAPDHAEAHFGLGVTMILTNRVAPGAAHCERSLALDRNLAAAHGNGLSTAKLLLGRAEETETHLREAFRISPRDRFAYMWHATGGIASVLLNKDEEAIPWLRQSIEIFRDYTLSHLYLCAALAGLGRIVEARKELQTVLELDPSFSLARYRTTSMSDNPTFLKQRERVYAALRLAGLSDS